MPPVEPTPVVILLQRLRRGDALSWRELLERGRCGDQEARRELLKHYQPYLRLLARVQVSRALARRVDDVEVAEEVFAQAYLALGTFAGDTEAELKSWLQTLVRRRVVDLWRYHKAKGRDPAREQALHRVLDQSSRTVERGLVGVATSPSQKAIRMEQAVLIANALDRLPADYREVLILENYENLKLAEIGALLGKSAGAIKQIKARALLRLRKLLAGPKPT